MSRTPNWTLRGIAWHEVLCLSSCVRERIRAHRHFGLDPLAFDWTSAPALERRRASLPIYVCCPSPDPGPHWPTHGVEPLLCIGRYEGTDMFLGRRGLHSRFSALAITMVREPQ